MPAMYLKQGIFLSADERKKYESILDNQQWPDDYLYDIMEITTTKINNDYTIKMFIIKEDNKLVVLAKLLTEYYGFADTKTVHVWPATLDLYAEFTFVSGGDKLNGPLTRHVFQIQPVSFS